MPQFLSATTTSSSATNTATANGGSGGGANGTATSTTTLVEGLKKQTRSSYHSHSRSHVGGYDDGSPASSDAEVHYPELDEDTDEGHNGGRKNGGYRLQLNHMETVSRTPKEHFSDQVGDQSVK